MTNKNDDLDDLSIDFNKARSSLNIDLVKQNLPKYNSQKLCEMIVCDRYFGCYKEIALMCMEELASRRIAGDEYNFEDYIESAFTELPVLNFNIPDLGDVLRQVISRKLKK